MHLTLRSRDTRLDTLRGLFLIIMAGVHLPTPLSGKMQEPFGYTSAAEGFVFLSACLAGFCYGKNLVRDGWSAMARRVWGRMKQIYVIHVTLVTTTAILAWALANSVTSLANHFHDFLLHPLGSLALMPLLLHQPPLFDILPMYVLLLAVTPLGLAAARRHGWARVLTVSAAVWLVAQFNTDTFLTGLASKYPAVHLASFNLLAWQFLWVAGLALGQTSLERPASRRHYPRVVVVVAAAIVLVGLLSRHNCWPDAWFNPDLFLWMNKWNLGPLRLLNFAAWVVLLLAWNPRVSTRWFAPMSLLGRHSLAVFAFHLPLVVFAGAILQVWPLSDSARTVIGILVISALFPWAVWLENRGHQPVATVPTPVLAADLRPSN